MEYYWIRESEAAGNIVCPQRPGTSRIWAGTEPMLVRGSVTRAEDGIRFLPFYQDTAMSRAFLVAARVWDIWKEVQRIGRFRPCAVGYLPRRDIRPYVFVMPPVLEALHGDTEFLRNGDIGKIRLKRGGIGADKVFAVRGGIQAALVLAEDVLEEMLRGGVTDFRYELLEQREG